MNATELQAVLATANPLPGRAATELPLHGAETELLEEILAIPVAHSPRPGRRPARLRRRSALALGLVGAAVIAAVIAIVAFGGGDAGPQSAFAAALVRFANASPRALLDLPHWHVVYADEQPGRSGELDFVRGPAIHGPADGNGIPQGASAKNEASLSGRIASLTWQPLTPATRERIEHGHQDASTGLGVTARQYVLEGHSQHWLDVSALLIYDNLALRFRATVPTMAQFRKELGALIPVSTTRWLRAMPPSVVKSADSGSVIHHMLEGVPLPPGFDAAEIRGARLVHDRYQLGAAVTGTVACMWIADWNRARNDGNTTMINRAIAAMATAPHWPILRQMAHQGGWSQILVAYAKAMPQGTWYGRPLAGDVNRGLGCPALGVRGAAPSK